MWADHLPHISCIYTRYESQINSLNTWKYAHIIAYDFRENGIWWHIAWIIVILDTSLSAPMPYMTATCHNIPYHLDGPYGPAHVACPFGLLSWECCPTQIRKHTSMGLIRTTFKLTQQPNRCGQSQSSEAWYRPSFHCEWSNITLTVHCSSLISGRHDVLSFRGPRFHFPRELNERRRPHDRLYSTIDDVVHREEP